MKWLREIAGRIWAFWGLISFVATFLIVLIPSMLAYLMPDPAGMRYFIKLARIWMEVWLRLVGCPIVVTGKQHFKKGEGYIITCNHNSLMDIPLSSAFIPGANKTIAKTSFAKIPLFGWYYRKGSVLVDRKSEISRRRSFEEMKKVLSLGMHMCIYPEGTRNRTKDPLKKFYDGAFKLAVDTGHAVMPAVILNTKKAVPIHKSFFFLPKRLEIHFLAPIDPAGLTVTELREQTFAVMWNYYREHN